MLKEHHEHNERQDVIDTYMKETEDYAKLIREVEKQRKEIEGEIQAMAQALEERMGKMDE